MQFFTDEKQENIFLSIYEKEMQDAITINKIDLKTQEGATEKHLPVIVKKENTIEVVVGQTSHPMEEKHYISMICLKTNQGFHVVHLNHNNEPNHTFYLSKNEKPITAYAFCNLHGMWKQSI